MRIAASSVVIISLFWACGMQDDTISSDGYWLQLGYGKIFEIRGDSVSIYDISKTDCTLHDKTLLANEGSILSFTADSLILKKNIKTYQFVHLAEQSPLCNNDGSDHLDPIHNFEVLWNTFNENYCYFDQRNIDWDKKYEKYRPQITKQTSEFELFKTCNEMLSSIGDGHVQLQVPENLKDSVRTLFQDDKKQENITPIVNRFELSDLIMDHYCENYNSHNAGIVKWGWMKNNIAYLQMNAMWLLAFYDIQEDLTLNEFGGEYMKIMSTRTFQRQDEIDGAKILMDSIFTDISNADALILDLRFNTGGKDEVGLEPIEHLVNKRTKIASKKAKSGDSFANHQDIYLEGRKPYFDKIVYILTSSLTASASEVGVLASLSLENVIKIGSPTEGIFSDGLDKKLPIGWKYTLSNEIYEDLSGNNYEGRGISPDIDMNYPKESNEFLNTLYDQLINEGDESIEKVILIEESKKQ